MKALNSSHFPQLRDKSLRNNLAGLKINMRPKDLFCFSPPVVLKTTTKNSFSRPLLIDSFNQSHSQQAFTGCQLCARHCAWATERYWKKNKNKNHPYAGGTHSTEGEQSTAGVHERQHTCCGWSSQCGEGRENAVRVTEEQENHLDSCNNLGMRWQRAGPG